MPSFTQSQRSVFPPKGAQCRWYPLGQAPSFSKAAITSNVTAMATIPIPTAPSIIKIFAFDDNLFFCHSSSCPHISMAHKQKQISKTQNHITRHKFTSYPNALIEIKIAPHSPGPFLDKQNTIISLALPPLSRSRPYLPVCL